jgi:uncharacterized membrane protein YcaP (DUF421 family)
MLLAKYGVEDWAGRGAGFRDFLRLSSAKENRSNRRTLPVTIYGVDPSEVARGVRLRLVLPASLTKSLILRGWVSMVAVFRAFFGYFFLVLIVRIVGRRPGKQMTPFEFVLIFFIGGLALTAIVGDEVSFTNGICEIVTMGLAHYTLAWARSKSPHLARLVDGTPLILLENHNWRVNTLQHMRIQDDDVIASARDSGIPTLQEIDRAVLERNGEISVSRLESTESNQGE